MSKCDFSTSSFGVVGIAQWLECITAKQEVGGSYPPQGAVEPLSLKWAFCKDTFEF